ncbi:MAG: right-handed parallel beta-helix repeat-containing protein [Ignavibacteriales bacterium]|nr:right-handed parallel beta-helix repeat-containing protein [Ignavibacteriales bacterium]
MKPKIFLPLLLSFLILNSSLLISTVRYVSPTGSSTPPYTSWETAADSIMECINISVFGDTIYVANGTYKEQVVMIPGLSLIGAGMDSCVIDTRTLIQPDGLTAIKMVDSCIVSDFKIILPNDEYSLGFISGSSWSIFERNRIVGGPNGGALISSNIVVRENILEGQYDTGIHISGFSQSYHPIVEENVFLNQSGYSILVLFGTKPTIRNNIIYLDGNFAYGYLGGGSDTVLINNNLVIAENASTGMFNSTVPHLSFNNYLTNNFQDDGFVFGINNNSVANNSVTYSSKGFRTGDNPSSIFRYNNSWNNDVNYSGFTPDSTNLSVDPMIANDDSTKGDLDFHLQMFSPLIDAGDPNILDKDGSRSDIGLWGGPYGEKYTYRDLAPKPSSNLTAVMDSGLVKLTWNKNTEADFYHYRVYRDTVPDFMYDTTKIIAVLSDTVYFDDPPQKFISGNYYYKITALDNTEHQSAPSEEAHINITGIPEAPPVVIDHYQLLNNYPNPFNPSTKIPYRLIKPGYVKLYVYDIKGEVVKLLVNGYQNSGYYEVEFNPNQAERERGKLSVEGFATGYNDDIATGIYIYQIMVRGEGDIPVFTDMGKMILLK